MKTHTEVLKTKREYMKRYRNRPGVKEKENEYKNRPGVKKKIKEYQKQYKINNQPSKEKYKIIRKKQLEYYYKNKEQIKQQRIKYRSNPEVIKKIREHEIEYRNRPEVKEIRNRLLRARRREGNNK